MGVGAGAGAAAGACAGAGAGAGAGGWPAMLPRRPETTGPMIGAMMPPRIPAIAYWIGLLDGKSLVV